MLIIKYCPEGEPVNNFNYQRWLEDTLMDYHQCKDKDMVVVVSTELPMLAMRKAIVEERLPHDQVLLRIKDKDFTISEFGDIQGFDLDFNYIDPTYELVCDIRRKSRQKIIQKGREKRENG